MSDYSREERNNRQIILWGTDGQEAVDNARIVVLGSDSVASEFLKNIVLHGFGNVTIIDDAIVNKEDLMTNFLVDANDLGKPRAQSVANLLSELNEDIKVTTKIQSPSDLSFIKEDPKPGFIVTCGNLQPSFLTELSKLCRENEIPQGHVQSVGLFGAFYLDAGLHEIYEGPYNNANPFSELRATEPFPELAEYLNSFDFNDKSDEDVYDHIPSPAIFYRAYSQLKKEGKLLTPEGRMDYNKIQAKIDDLTNGYQRMGFVEAGSNKFNYTKPAIPPNVQEVFKISDEHPDIKKPFWELVRATKRFCEAHNALPHYGGCPDLDTSTGIYLHLKKLYENKSAKDWQEIRDDLAKHNEKVDEKVLTRFLKSVFRIGYLDYKPISDTINFIPPQYMNQDATVTVACLFVALRNFYEKNKREPENTKEDQEALVAEIKQLGGENDEEITNYVKEFSISKNHVIPSVAATIGAMFAEEVTKIVIHQARPVNGAFIYNGVKCFGTTFP